MPVVLAYQIIKKCVFHTLKMTKDNKTNTKIQYFIITICFSNGFLFKKKSKISFGSCFLTLHLFLGFFTVVHSLSFLIQVFFNVVKPTLMKFLYKQRCWIWRFHGIWKKKKASLIKIMPCPSEIWISKMDKAKNCFGFIIYWPFQNISDI